MRDFITTALHLRLIVVAATVTLMLVGSELISRAPIDVFPEFAPPRVEVQTEVPGLSAEEVEALVSVPLENALAGLAWSTSLRSKSVPGLSSVTMFFEEDVDLMQARQLMQERVALVVNRLPVVARPPVILPPMSSTSRVLKIGMQSAAMDRMNQMDLSELAVWTVRPRLMAIPGVANVAVWGQRDRQMQIQVDPDRLQAFGLTLNEVATAARNAALLSGGSFIEGPNQRLNVTHLPALSSVEDITSIVVAQRNGAVVTFGDVADVVEGFPPPIGDAIINDGPGILLIVEKQPWGNTLDVTRGVENALQELLPALEGVQVDSTIFRPATYIENSIANLNTALLIGCVLVILVLGIFLYDWRAAMISVVAIPLSLITAALVLSQMGSTINSMVLAGLIIALGEVVDDAIIDVENIIRRLRLNAASPTPESVFKIVVDASFEIRSAVIFGSLIAVLALLPVMFLDGLSGAFFRPLAYSYVIAILASLLVALIVTPALSLMLLPRAVKQNHAESPLLRWLKPRYVRVLEKFIASPRKGLGLLAAAAVVALAIVPFLGRELLPNFKEYDFLMHWLERPSTSLEAMNRATILVSRELRQVPGVRNFGAHVGRAEVADEVVGIDFTELWISLDRQVDYDTAVAQVQEIINGYPGLFRDLLTYLRERIKEVLSGSSGSIVIRIFGPDLAILGKKANEVAAALRDIEGINNLHVQHQTLIPQVEIKFKPERAAAFGLNPGDIRQITDTLLNGMTVGQIYQQQKIFDIVVCGTPRFSRDIDALRSISIDLPAVGNVVLPTGGNTTIPAGGNVTLADIADVYVAPAQNQITREDASRRIDVSLDAAGRSLSAVAADVERILGGIAFDNGYFPKVIGEAEELRRASSRLGLAALFSVCAIFLILHTYFGSARQAAIIFIALPTALIGGVIAVFMEGGILSLGSLIGFITVLGISARNGIMMVSHFHHLEEVEGIPFGLKLVLRGASERLPPILMTTLTTGLALFPIVAGGIKPGHEIEHPMAIVILGGLTTSCLLNLFIVPLGYWKLRQDSWGKLPESPIFNKN